MFDTRVLVPGKAEGPVIALGEPLSFWGGFDPESGRIVDERHALCGRSLMGGIVVMPTGRGSSSSSSVLAEAIRLGTAPAAIVLAAPDEVIALGSLVAAELYGRLCPVLVAAPDVYEAVEGADAARVTAEGIEAINA